MKAFYFSEICNITTSRKIASSNEQSNSNNINSVCVMKKKIHDSTHRREPNVKQLRNPFVP